MKIRKSVSGMVLGFCLALGVNAVPASAQQNADEPQLSPMLFGETLEERRAKIDKEQQEQELARKVSAEQQLDQQKLDEPNLEPLLFGPPRDNDDEEDLSGARITLGEKDNNRGFFSAFNFLIPAETNLSLGLGPIYEPDYLGSDDYEFNPDPQVYVRFKNFVFLDDDGADFALFGFSSFRIGPSVRIRGRRDEGENIALQGLGDVGMTFEFGGFAATTFADRFGFKARVRHGIKTGHRGTVVDGTMSALLFRSDAFSLSATAQSSWVGNRFADAYFSVTPQQSLNTGGRLQVFDANAGFLDIGASVTGYINILDRWSLNPYATYSYIYGDIAKTPIIADYGNRDQFTFGFHLMREFDFKVR